MRNARYPAGAFALTFILFTENMKTAMAAGILLLFVDVAMTLLKMALQHRVPGWSLKACLYIGASSLCAGCFQTAFYYLGIDNTVSMWLLEFILGLLCAHDVLGMTEEPDYNGILLDAAYVWGILIAAGILREFLTDGSIYGGRFGNYSFLSTVWKKLPFGILAAGIGLGISNQVLNASSGNGEPFVYVLPVLLLNPGFSVVRVLGIVLTFVFYISIKKRIIFSPIPFSFRKLPAGLLCLGIICMILSDFLFTIR